MFKNGDLVFLANSETSHAIELVVEVKEMSEHFIVADKFIAIHKVHSGNGEMNYQGLPDGGLVSNRSNLTNSASEVTFNLHKFDLFGLVTNSEIMEQFSKTTSKIIHPTQAKKGLIA